MELRKKLNSIPSDAYTWFGILCVSAALWSLCSTAFSQQTIAPFKTQQANTVFYVNMGNTTLTTIQKTITTACAYATATLVDILPGANPSDTIAGLTSACTNTMIFDQRVMPAANYTCAAGGCTLVPPVAAGVTSVSGNGTQGVTVSVTNPTSNSTVNVGLANITPTSVSTATITNTSLAAGNVVASGTGGVQTNGPTVTDIALHDLANFFSQTQSLAALTLATSSANVSSPALNFTANVWNGTGSTPVTFSMQSFQNPGTNANPTLTIFGPPGANISFLNNTSFPFVSANTVFGAGVESGASGIGAGALGAATSSANFNSSPLAVGGSFWNGTFSATDQWIWTDVLGAGSNPTTTYTLSQSGSPGAKAVSIPFPISVKALQVTTAMTPGAGMQIATGTGCLSPANNDCVATLTMPVAEPDTNYVVTGCMSTGVVGGVSIPANIGGTITTTQFQMQLFNPSPTAVTSMTSVNCLVTHP